MRRLCHTAVDSVNPAISPLAVIVRRCLGLIQCISWMEMMHMMNRQQWKSTQQRAAEAMRASREQRPQSRARIISSHAANNFTNKIPHPGGRHIVFSSYREEQLFFVLSRVNR